MIRFGSLLLILFHCCSADADEILIHDAHIHYDEDVWGMLSPEKAISMLRREGIQRALVSGTPTEGAEKLYREAPELVIPMLRPYRSWRHRYLWFSDDDLEAYLLEHLDRVPYRGFGEFHVFGYNMDSEPIEDMIRIARERGLVLHPHTDLVGMKILLPKAKDVTILWAHGGFDIPTDVLEELLQRYPGLHIELSLREGMIDTEGKLLPAWQRLLSERSERFLVGMDTYKPSRWAELPEIAAESRGWLAQLPEAAAQRIANGNLDRLFPMADQSR